MPLKPGEAQPSHAPGSLTANWPVCNSVSQKGLASPAESSPNLPTGPRMPWQRLGCHQDPSAWWAALGWWRLAGWLQIPAWWLPIPAPLGPASDPGLFLWPRSGLPLHCLAPRELRCFWCERDINLSYPPLACWCCRPAFHPGQSGTPLSWSQPGDPETTQGIRPRTFPFA